MRTAAHKVVHVVVVLLLVSFFAAFMLDLVPGGPAVALLGEQATPEQIADINQQLGLDRNVFVRYVDWVGSAVQGDLGTSYSTGEDVTATILDRLPVTLELAVLALLMALVVSIPLGIIAAYRADTPVDRVSTTSTSLLIAFPPFVAGLVLVYLLAVRYGVFPATGWVPVSESLSENVKHAFLPALTLAIAEIPAYMRLLRADMISTLQQDFILAARAKGVPTRRILFRHALRPSSFSLVTVAGLSLGRLIGGAVIVETLFALPGLGQLIIVSIQNQDLFMIQGVVMFSAVAYVLVNAGVDVGYRLLDPRVRTSGAG